MTLLVDFYVQSASVIPPPLNLVLGWPGRLRALVQFCRRRPKEENQAEQPKLGRNPSLAVAGRVPLGQEHRDETRAYHAYLQQREADDSSVLDARVIKVADNMKVSRSHACERARATAATRSRWAQASSPPDISAGTRT
jgi:hypothetical protein